MQFYMIEHGMMGIMLSSDIDALTHMGVMRTAYSTARGTHTTSTVPCSFYTISNHADMVYVIKAIKRLGARYYAVEADIQAQRLATALNSL